MKQGPMDGAVEPDIRRLHDALMSSLNDHDKESALSLFSDEVLYVDEQGGESRGYASLSALFDVLGAADGGALHFRFLSGRARQISERIGIFEGDFEAFPPLSGRRIHGHWMDVAELRKGSWTITEVHPRIFPTASP